MPESGRRFPLSERAGSAWEALRSSFGFLTGVAMVVGLIAGFGLPAIDEALNIDLPVFEFTSQDSARSLLEVVATATVSVAGLSFSVTVVAFTLASSQLSPRVLRTFRSDRLSQATLAAFLGTFIYCIAVLVRLGSTADGQPVPNLSTTVAMVLAFTAFAMFAAFIAHIVRLLQPASLIEGIRSTGAPIVEAPYPSGVGESPEDPAAAERAVAERGATRSEPVTADGAGYVTTLRGRGIVEAAAARDALVVQRTALGEYVAEGTVLADLWCEDAEDREALAETVKGAFGLGSQRTPVQDVAFPIRQLADVALKGLSPGINDQTTAENAMDAATALLVRSASVDKTSRLRCDADGAVRLVALAPSLDDLVRLAFEQVRVAAAPTPVVGRRLLTLLERIERAASKAGLDCTEPARQAALIAEGGQRDLPAQADGEDLRAAHARLWPPGG